MAYTEPPDLASGRILSGDSAPGDWEIYIKDNFIQHEADLVALDESHRSATVYLTFNEFDLSTITQTATVGSVFFDTASVLTNAVDANAILRGVDNYNTMWFWTAWYTCSDSTNEGNSGYTNFEIRAGGTGTVQEHNMSRGRHTFYGTGPLGINSLLDYPLENATGSRSNMWWPGRASSVGTVGEMYNAFNQLGCVILEPDDELFWHLTLDHTWSSGTGTVEFEDNAVFIAQCVGATRLS